MIAERASIDAQLIVIGTMATRCLRGERLGMRCTKSILRQMVTGVKPEKMIPAPWSILLTEGGQRLVLFLPGNVPALSRINCECRFLKHRLGLGDDLLQHGRTVYPL